MPESLWLAGALGGLVAVLAVIVWPEWPIWRRMLWIVVVVLIFNIGLALAVDKIVEAVAS